MVYYIVAMGTSSPDFVKVMGGESEATVLTGLKPYSRYSVSVQAITNSGRDGLPSEVWVTTREGGRASIIHWTRDCNVVLTCRAIVLSWAKLNKNKI